MAAFRIADANALGAIGSDSRTARICAPAAATVEKQELTCVLRQAARLRRMKGVRPDQAWIAPFLRNHGGLRCVTCCLLQSP